MIQNPEKVKGEITGKHGQSIDVLDRNILNELPPWELFF